MPIKQKKILIAVGAVLIVLLVVALFVFLRDGSPDMATPSLLPDQKFEKWEQGGMDEAAMSAQAKLIFDEAGVTYDDIIEAARTGRISLVSEFWRLRRKCPADMALDDCNLLILQFIKDKLPPPDNLKMVELYRKYLKYEESMLSFKLSPDMSDEEQYEAIRDKRRQIFGGTDAELIFGYEETRFDFSQAYAKFAADTRDMPGDKRLQAYEEMRKKVYGNYYQAMLELEPPFDRYTTEMDLRGADLQKLDPKTQGAEIRQIREKYFGAAGAERMAGVDRMLDEQEKREGEYRKAEAEFLRNNAALSDVEKEKKLSELRVKYLGSEEAEAFARREALRKAEEGQ